MDLRQDALVPVHGTNASKGGMEMARVAINGLGRIGHAAMKQMMEASQIEVVAVNDVIPLDNLAYLLKFDTVYGRYE
jgi:glyceraldehyde 3-phosphate dehydrogenase